MLRRTANSLCSPRRCAGRFVRGLNGLRSFFSVGRRRSFDFFKSRIGLTQCECLQLGSPFDYQRQAQLILVRDMPDPNQQKQEYDRLCAAMIRRYVARTDGRAFVLFTSYEMIRRVAQLLTPWLASRDLALYSQADGLPRGKMKLVLAWIEIHADELMADWQLAVSGQHPFKIEPLR